jgi:hypothetical protein
MRNALSLLADTVKVPDEKKRFETEMDNFFSLFPRWLNDKAKGNTITWEKIAPPAGRRWTWMVWRGVALLPSAPLSKFRGQAVEVESEEDDELEWGDAWWLCSLSSPVRVSRPRTPLSLPARGKSLIAGKGMSCPK